MSTEYQQWSNIAFVGFLLMLWLATHAFWVVQKDYPSFVQQQKQLLASYQVPERCGNFLCFSSSDFSKIYHSFEQNLEGITQSGIASGDIDFDSYLHTKALNRGYQLRPLLVNEDSLAVFQGKKIPEQVLRSFLNLQTRMSEDNIQLYLSSAFRNVSDQNEIFQERLGADYLNEEGYDDLTINSVLATTAPGGYSKHHSGYAIDVACGEDFIVFDFKNTECYEWMAFNNFERIKALGFIPSYPEGAQMEGPNPEAWEYVWVGSDTIQSYQQELFLQRNK